MLRLLCVTAHPDDEAGAFGGTLSKYAESGVETYVLCLTAGTAASHRGASKTNEELAALRRLEFAESIRHLKVTCGEVLNYHDGALDRECFADVVGTLVKKIREIKPQVVITFGGEGAITAHPDHGMASAFATMAFHWASHTNRYAEQLQNGLAPHQAQKLYYGTNDFMLPERQPVSLPPASALVEFGTELLERKVQAFKKHATQAPLFELFETNTRKRGNPHEERYLLVAKNTPGVIVRESDLFAGVVE